MNITTTTPAEIDFRIQELDALVTLTAELGDALAPLHAEYD